jgi:hypothetical protein
VGVALNIKAFLEGAVIGIFGDYILFVIIQSLAKTTPEWGTYGWGLFVAYNAAIVFWLRHALKSKD